METVVALRDELKCFIDTMPESKLTALKPLLSVLVDDYSIETDLTNEEKELVSDSLNRYRKDPSSFVSLKNLY